MSAALRLKRCFFRICHPLIFLATAGTLTLGASGCVSLDRLAAVPYEQAQKTKVFDIPEARFYVNDRAIISAVALKSYQRRNKFRNAATPQYFLAISGGGDDGAFGAGLLVGWGDRGDKPTFDVVTGVSTGALSAPFAFLGRGYDGQLKDVYTKTSVADIAQQRPALAAITGDALADSAPLRRLIASYVDDTMIKTIAEEYDKGRLLFILTTNLDQGRAVIWNIGAIAGSNNPNARDLIVNILLASASIPVVFPPVMLDVTADGQHYQEMHVDGGTIAQAFLYPPSFSLRQAALKFRISESKLRAARKRVAYIIRNGRLSKPDENTKLQTFAIARQAISTMITSSGINDTYRMYLITKRDGVDFNLASIGDDFEIPYKGPFDSAYMNSLFEYGYQKGRVGYRWQKAPPGYSN